MKRLYIIAWTLTVLLTAAKAQTQTGINAMQQAFKAFLASPGVMTKDTHWSRMHEQWTFKYVCQGDTMPVPAALQALTDAFYDNVRYATASYYHTPQDGPTPFTLKTFSRKDEFRGTVTGVERLTDNDYSYTLNFTDMSSGLTSYNLVWHEVAFRDRNGQPFRTIDGTIYRHYGGIWRMEKFRQADPWQLKAEQMNRPVGADDQSRYESLLAQVNYLANSYREQQKKGNEKGCDAVVYMLKKVCDGFDGQLMQQQFDEIAKATSVFLSKDAKTERTRIVSRAVGKLWGKVVVDRLLGEMRFGGVVKGTFVHPDQIREIDECYDYGFKKRPQVKVLLTVRTSPKCRKVTIQQQHPINKPYAVTGDSGRFTFSQPFMPDQLLEVSDGEGHRMVIFTDSVATDIDLTDMTLHGSPLNERFADCQQRLRALEPEIHKYATVEEVGGNTIMDEAGFRRLADDAHQLQMQFIRENQDNLIPVWYIAENYAAMTLDELEQSLTGSHPYDSLVALQPARAQYEGLLKRRPGNMFHDVACIDTAGISHQLSDYIGRGDYVVMYCWSTNNRYPRNGVKVMKQLMREHKGKNLRVIGFSMDEDKDRWRRYIKSRKVNFDVHLAIPGNTDKFSKGTGMYPDLWRSEFMTTYGLHSLVETIVFDPEGRIVSTGLMGDPLIEHIRALPLK